MAICAGTRCWLIKEDVFAVYRFDYLMTCRACNVLVSAFEREICGVVIKERRLPLIAVMTCRTVILPRAELIGVRILMAFVACFRRFSKANVHERTFKVWRLVAIRARYGAVRAYERKLSGAMVEPREFVPVLCVMADLASVNLVVAHCRHSLIELPFVHILMASGAAKLREMIAHEFPA